MLNILGKDVRGCKSSTRVKICIPYTYIPLLKGVFVCLSPAGSSVDILGTVEDARITHTFNTILLLKACYHYLGDRVTFTI